MDVKANSLYQEMQSMIGQSRMTANEMPSELPNDALDVKNTSATDFSVMLKSAIDGVNNMQMESKDLTQRFEMGDPNISMAEVMLTKEKAGIAFEATIQVRNKVLEAYKTIMNMPV